MPPAPQPGSPEPAGPPTTGGAGGAGGSGGDRPGPAPLVELRALLEGHVRRERWLLVGRSALQLLAVLLAVGLLAAVLVSYGAPRVPALVAVVLLALIGGGLAVALPLGRRWRDSGDLRRQARLVETAEPALRSRLLTAVDRALLPAEAGGEAGVVIPLSGPLLDRAVARAAGLSREIPGRELHPARPLGRTLLAAVAVAALVGLGSSRLPVGPLAALGALASGDVAAARMAGAVEVADEQALVGDITLRYLFPDYTGMQAVEIPNSDGTIHAPPGTVVEIRARTGEPFDGAAIEVTTPDGPQPARDVALIDRRDLSARLLVEGEGSWRFRLFRGEEIVSSPDYRIVVEEDAAPVVTLEASSPQVGLDQPLGMRWTVQDDFGIAEVVLEVTRGDGSVERHVLREPLDPVRQLDGTVLQTPAELGLRPGEEVGLKVVARDNDGRVGGSETPGSEAPGSETPGSEAPGSETPGSEAPGSEAPGSEAPGSEDEARRGKEGASAALSMEIIGPRSAGRQAARYYRELRDAMVLALADFLVETEDLPVANDPAAMQRWVEEARGRFDPVEAAVDRAYGGETPSNSLDGQAVSEVLEDAARLLRFTLTTFDPASSRRVTMSDLATYDELHDAQIDSLERAIYLIDQVMEAAAFTDMARQAQEVAQEARELAELSEDAEASELLARLDQLERLMSQLAATAARMSEGSLREFVNRELDQAGLVMDEIRKAVAEGRLDDAREMLERLAEQLEQMSSGMQEQMAQGEAQEQELMEELGQAMEDLEGLEQDQRDLSERISEAQSEEGSDFQQQMELWQRLDELSGLLVTQADQAVDATGDGAGWRVDGIRRMELAARHAGDLRDAIRARDPAVGLERAQATTWRVEQAQRAGEAEAVRPRLAGEAVPAGVPVAREALREAGRTVAEIAELLAQLHQQQQRTSPEMQQLAQQMSAEQQALQERQQQLQREVQQIERQMPSSEGKAADAMQGAGEAMEQASEQLSQGEPVPGQGHMEEAADRLRAAREELQSQQQQMQQMQQAQQRLQGEQPQGGDQQGEGQQDRGEGQDGREGQRVELPAPESFQTPEEYRRALLEGMEADVPEEYEALKKQYYEELVRQ